MNKYQKYFCTFWVWVGLSTIITIINPIVGLWAFFLPIFGFTFGVIYWALKDLYKDLGD